MDVIESHVIESHGAKIPVIGFGTMTLKDNLCVELVEAALHLGYRHLDTAQNYGNEREVGEGFRASGVPREDVFITTKVWFNRLAPGDLERSVDESLERLKLPWVDLLLIHWPNAQIPLAGSIDALCKVKRAGLAKHIGVANFTVAMLDEATKAASEPLAALQIETHPYLDQTKVLAAAHRHGMAVVGYCPLARGKVPADAVLQHDRPCPRQVAGTSVAALPRAGKDHSDPADVEARAARGKSRQPRIQADGRRDGGDRHAGAAGLAHRQPAAGAAMG